MVCMEYFRQFLLAEGVLEYILCWIEIEIFKDYCETQEDIDGHLTEDALRIYDRYLRDNTEFEVPVSDGARKAIERVITIHLLKRPQLSSFRPCVLIPLGKETSS